MNQKHLIRYSVLWAVVLLLAFSTGCQSAAIPYSASQAAPATNVQAVAPSAADATTPLTPSTSSTAPTTAAITGAAAPLPASNDGFSQRIKEVAQLVKPAVVQITNQQVQVDQFNQPFTIPAGVGSGVIYDAKGYIITNNHVVAGADKLLVTLPDGRSFKATLVGGDPQTDLAVLKIDGTNLPVAPLGDSSQLQVGDWVVAIGNALALQGGPTVTAGVASALGRTVQEPPDANTGQSGPYLFDVIQTSAPINPGNSGGALVNLEGQVVGINTLVAGQAEPGVQAQGIGFAIGINTAKPIADQLVSTGQVIHPFIGISYVPLTPAISAQLGISQQTGMILADVAAGTPAAQAGLQRYDVITAINGQQLQGDSDLAQIIDQHKPGDTLTLTVVRNSQTLTIKVTLGTRPVSMSDGAYI
jgi:S1-C subfamily serine protease